MSKQFTMLMPHVPEEFIYALRQLPHPLITDMQESKIARGVSDLEITFRVSPDNGETEEDSIKGCKGSLILALIMFYEANPDYISRVLIHLVTSTEEWRKRAIEVRISHPKDPQLRLMQWLIHDLSIMGGDLMGVDHRPCWDAGHCLHKEE